MITEEQGVLVARLLCERISPRGGCRTVDVGLRWLLQLMVTRFPAAAEYLHIEPQGGMPTVIRRRLEAELDERWSFVGKPATRHWVWIARDAATRQVLAFQIGDRGGQSAQALGTKIPIVYHARAVFYTDPYQHRMCSLTRIITTIHTRAACTLPQLNGY